MFFNNDPIGQNAPYFEYAGSPQTTQSCIDAFIQYLNSNDSITVMSILSCNHCHALMLTFGESNRLAFIRSGFTSGYPGEGPKGLAKVFRLAQFFNIQIREFNVNEDWLKKVNYGQVTQADVQGLDQYRSKEPTACYDYLDALPFKYDDVKGIFNLFKEIIPYSIIDPAISDLLEKFKLNPGETLSNGYKRLEQHLQEKFKTNSFGTKIFEMFLRPEKANNNIWHDNPSNGICKARYDLFKACFEGFRNERAHNEYVYNEDALFELILLNYLFKITKFLNQRAKKQGA